MRPEEAAHLSCIRYPSVDGGGAEEIPTTYAPDLLSNALANIRVEANGTGEYRSPTRLTAGSTGSNMSSAMREEPPSGRSEPWLTKQEVAAEYRISTRTVERLGFPFTRVGGQNRYRRSEVEAAIERGLTRRPHKVDRNGEAKR
jgi:hypothetical protein